MKILATFNPDSDNDCTFEVTLDKLPCAVAVQYNSASQRFYLRITDKDSGGLHILTPLVESYGGDRNALATAKFMTPFYFDVALNVFYQP